MSMSKKKIKEVLQNIFLNIAFKLNKKFSHCATRIQMDFLCYTNHIIGASDRGPLDKDKQYAYIYCTEKMQMHHPLSRLIKKKKTTTERKKIKSIGRAVGTDLPLKLLQRDSSLYIYIL